MRYSACPSCSESTFVSESTGSRKFTEQEIRVLDSAIRKALSSRKYNLSSRDKRFLNRALESLRRYQRLPGSPVMLHHHRLGPFDFVTFLLPEGFQDAAPDYAKYELYRDGVCRMLEECLGGDYVLGYRMGPHRGRTRGRHLHLALSLLRFPRSLEVQARAFRHLNEDEKAKVFSAFFIGRHLEADAIHPLLVQPYSELLHRVFGNFADDPLGLIHVGEAQDEVQTDIDRERVNRYLSNPWKKFKDKKLLGFYPHRRDGEVLVQHTGDDGQKRRLGADAFVREFLLNPVEKWLRRGSRGFLHGRSHLAAVMDFAAKQPHPTLTQACYLDQPPQELSTLAVRALDQRGDTFVNGTTEPPLESRKLKKSKDIFPLKELGALLSDWPFYRLRFEVPATAWSTFWLPDRLDGAMKAVDDLIRKHFEFSGQTIGYFVVPDNFDGEGSDTFTVCVFLSRLRFFKIDLDLVRGFLNLPDGEKDDFLPAFFRHPPLECSASVMDNLNDAWRQLLQSHGGLHIVPEGCLLQAVADDRTLADVLERSGDHFRLSIRHEIETLTIEACGKDSWRYIMPNGEASGPFRSRETLGRHLDNLLEASSPRKFGFFHNRTETFGQLARMAVGLDHNQLRGDGDAALEPLCDRLELDPMTFRKLTITDLVGNAAKKRKAATG